MEFSSRTTVILRLALVGAVFSLSYPAKLAARIIGLDEPSGLLWGYLGSLSMIALPFLLSWLVPTLAKFERRWLQCTQRHLAMTVLLAVAAILFAFIGAALIMWGVLPGPEKRPFFAWTPVVPIFAGALLILVVPIAEEIFWRGYVQDQLQQAVSPAIAAPLQAVLFGLAHWYLGLACIVPMGYGFIFGLWRMKQRTLLPLILAHIAVNALSTVPVYYRAYQNAQLLKGL